MASNSNRHSNGKAQGRPPVQFELSEEEKAVLVECRRNSLIRGAAVGLGSLLGLRYLISQGKVPAQVMRWPLFYYSGTFIVTSMIGVTSYKKKCLEKLMALENSSLANMVRDIKAGRTPSCEEKTDGVGEEWRKGNTRGYPVKSGAPPPVSSSSKQPDSMVGIYNNKESDEKKGKTFDEIREENRAKQMQRRYPQRPREDEREIRPQSTPKNEGTNGSRPLKRNTYGDIVYDDK